MCIRDRFMYKLSDCKWEHDNPTVKACKRKFRPRKCKKAPKGGRKLSASGTWQALDGNNRVSNWGDAPIDVNGLGQRPEWDGEKWVDPKFTLDIKDRTKIDINRRNEMYLEQLEKQKAQEERVNPEKSESSSINPETMTI